MADEKRMERIEIKLDDLADAQAEMNVILGQQHISLREHVKRSNMLEEQMKPLQRHVTMMQGVFKFVSTMFAFLGALAAIFECARMYFHV